MFTRNGLFSKTGRSVVLATVAAVSLTAIAPSFAFAASPAAAGVSTAAVSHGATDFSSAKKRRHYSRNGNAAALAAFAGIVGTIGSIAAAQSARDDYYYGGGPGYYGGPAYGPGYGYYGRRDPYGYHRYSRGGF